MPTYEYKCNACDHRFEQFQSIKAAPVRKCPKCGKRAVERLISAGAGLIFKGSGFYITDYRSESYKSEAKSDAPAAPAIAASDTKAATGSKESTASTPAATPPATPAASEAKTSTSKAKAPKK